MPLYDKPPAQDIEKLFASYRLSRDVTLRNELVMAYSYIAKAVAGQMRGAAQSYAQMEDIVNQGIITLIDCVEKFDETKEVKFESYAFAKVKNSIIDYLRQQDFLPRRVRKLAKDIHEAEKVLGDRHFREPTLAEVAEYMDISPEQLKKHYAELSRASIVSLDELYHRDDNEDDFDIESDDGLHKGLFAEEQRGELIKAIELLNERERLIISLYYFEKLKIGEIAHIMSVSESRVSQLHVRALNSLKDKLTHYVKN